MRKFIIAYIIIVAVLSCTVTLIGVRKSNNTKISTEANRDSIDFDLGDWNLNRSGNDSIKINKTDTIK